MMFGALPIDFDKQSKKFTNLLESFVNYENTPNISAEFYEFVKNNLTNHEQGFSDQIIDIIETAKLAMQNIYPKNDLKFHKKKLIEHFKSDSYSQNLSLKLIDIVGEQLEIKLDEEEAKKRAYFLRKQLPLSVGFFQWILTTIIEKNIDMTSHNSKAKRWNWIWDYQISFLISESNINDGRMILVTSDKEVKDILNQYNLGDKVMDITEYLNFLNINGNC